MSRWLSCVLLVVRTDGTDAHAVVMSRHRTRAQRDKQVKAWNQDHNLLDLRPWRTESSIGATVRVPLADLDAYLKRVR